MTNTRDKLNEAKFFLLEIKKVVPHPNKFRYMLTAFLAASRSITLIMQKEFDKKSGFSDWYNKKEEEMKKSPVLKYILKRRNLALHQRPVLQYPIGISETITDQKRTNIVLTGTGSSIASSSVYFMSFSRLKPISGAKYYFDDFMNREKDVISICKETIMIIEDIVDECENKFYEGGSEDFDFK
ncbi:MAG: hypothetical protein K9M01_02080 [Candidatus Omnitrophica bacterium]|nr:hypothetical protein [Candidatus Omnitrophota bacterium]